MGEIIFSLFIGGYLAAVGLFLNWFLYREQKRSKADKDTL